MIIEIRQLGLAAFIKTVGKNDVKFIGWKDGNFVFESDKCAYDWRVEYSNHVCSDFDKSLMELRAFIKNGKDNNK